MKLRTLTLGLGLITSILATGLACAKPLKGDIGASAKSGSGWLVLHPPVSFKHGERIMIKVGGTADKVIVRFLPKGGSPDDPVGIDGGAQPVPPTDRTIYVTLQYDHPDTEQISVHGGSNPWGLYPLGENNGPATILSAQRVGH